MTSHQFAKSILEMPDLPIATPLVKEWSDDEEDNLRNPVATIKDATDVEGTPIKVILLTH